MTTCVQEGEVSKGPREEEGEVERAGGAHAVVVRALGARRLALGVRLDHDLVDVCEHEQE